MLKIVRFVRLPNAANEGGEDLRVEVPFVERWRLEASGAPLGDTYRFGVSRGDGIDWFHISRAEFRRLAWTLSDPATDEVHWE